VEAGGPPRPYEFGDTMNLDAAATVLNAARRQAARCLVCHVQTIYDPELCVLCNRCVDVCPEYCLQFVPFGDVDLPEDQRAAVTARATRLPTGVYPARLHEAAFAVVKRAFPAVEPVEDALSAALMNAGPVIHPPLIFMNAGPLEHFERWDIHKEGTQPAIRRVTDALDAERIAARVALGYAAPHFPLADHYREDGEEWMYGRRVHAKLTGSGDWKERIVLEEHRYMREDVVMGLAFLVSVCEWAGVACPVAQGLLALGSAVLGRSLRKGARTLEALGLARLSREGMRALLREGR